MLRAAKRKGQAGQFPPQPHSFKGSAQKWIPYMIPCQMGPFSICSWATLPLSATLAMLRNDFDNKKNVINKFTVNV